MAQLAIRGHETRGKEVIEILKMLGAKEKHLFTGDGPGYYYIDEDNNISYILKCHFHPSIKPYSLAEFFEKFPYKIKDKVIYHETNAIVTQMKWDGREIVYTVECNKELWETTVFYLQPYKEKIVEDEAVHNKWTGLKVELELSKSVIGVSNIVDLYGERFMSGFVKAIIPPEGYDFYDDKGSVINTTKIVLKKKDSNKLKLESTKKVREYWSEYARIFIEIYNDKPNECVLTHLYTLENHRQKGYGKQALSEAESIAKELGCRTAYLKVETDSWMHQWYLRSGYQWYKNADKEYTWLTKNLI